MAVRHIDVSEAQLRLAQLIDEALRGDEVVIVRGTEPVAKLVPLGRRSRGGFGSARGLIWMADDFDEPPEDFTDYTSAMAYIYPLATAGTMLTSSPDLRTGPQPSRKRGTSPWRSGSG